MRPKANVDKVIMGIDPGTNYTGYGLIRIYNGSPECITIGYIEQVKIRDPYKKLGNIFSEVVALIDRFSPDEIAFEAPFFGHNVQSMLKLGRAQGIAMAAALMREIPVYEYAPRRIKQSITGNGGASKMQVASMLKSILKIEPDLKKLDATDGLAVALCHHYEMSSVLGEESCSRVNALGGGIRSRTRKGSSSWAEFLKENPERELRNSKKLTNNK